MTVRLVTYDLHKPGQDYSDFLEAMKNLGSWAKLSESCYAVETTLSPKQVFDKLSPHIDSNDNLYILTLVGPFYGQGPQDVNDWLAKRL